MSMVGPWEVLLALVFGLGAAFFLIYYFVLRGEQEQAAAEPDGRREPV